MEPLKLSKILRFIGGSVVKGTANVIIKKVVTRADRVKDNTLYFYFGNKKANWNKYRSDPSNVIVTETPARILTHTGNSTVVKVNDIEQAYWGFVQFYRGLFQIPVIGVTGTCGKTTTTEMIKTILAKKWKTRSTFDGNNIWYLSLPYLLGIDSQTEAAVFEMGVGKPGDLKYILKHYRPQIGVLLNIGTYHLLGCKTLDNYIKAKGELLEGLGNKGTVILNSDDRNISKLDLTKFKGDILYFGIKEPAHYKARDIRYTGEGMQFTLIHQNTAQPVYVPGYGRHNVYNALAAIAAACCTGITPEAAIAALASFHPVRQHMQIQPGVNGCKIIDDTWNCTPLSMESAINVLSDMGSVKTRVAVFGYMPQLGAAGNKEYHRIGEMAAAAGIDYLLTIGEAAAQIGQKAIETGFDRSKVFFCNSAAELHSALLPLTGQGAVILFKFPYKYRLSKDPSYREFMNSMIAESG